MSTSQPDPASFWSYQAHRQQQVRRGLELSALERLQWLESTMAELQSLVGRASEQVAAGVGRPSHKPDEPIIEDAFSDDGVDLTLIRWMLELSPTDRLRAAQDLIDTTWALRTESET